MVFPKQLLTNTLTSIFMWAILLGGLWYGFPYANAALALIAAYMALEWVYLIRHEQATFSGGLLASAAAFTMGAISFLTIPQAFVLAILSGLPAMLFSMHLTQKKWLEIAAAGPLILLPIVCLLWLTIMAPQATQHLIWLFATLWALDITAFVVSHLFHGPKLAPKLIATRTWAGTIAGVIAAFAAAAGVAMYYQAPVDGVLFYSIFLILAALAGDFLFCLLRNHFGERYSDMPTPAFSSMLDRFDSLLLTAIVLSAIVLSDMSPFMAF